MARSLAATVSIRALLPVLHASGARVQWADLGVDPMLAQNPEARVPATVLLDALALAEARTGDPHLGLHLAERSDPKRLDVVMFLLRHSANVRQALVRLTRYLRLLNEAFVWRLDEDADGAEMSVEVQGLAVDSTTPGLRGLFELSLGTGMRALREYTGAPVPLQALAFAAAPPPTDDEVRRVFGIVPRWDAPRTLARISADVLGLPFHGADPELGQVLERYAEELLSALPSPSLTWTDRVRAQLLQSASPDAGPTLTEVARILAVSPRSLQRRLAEENTTFAALVDETLRVRAEKYLRDSDLPIAEVGWLLGFNDQSAFHRAFRRWTGQTPLECRRRRGASGTSSGAPGQ